MAGFLKGLEMWRDRFRSISTPPFQKPVRLTGGAGHVEGVAVKEAGPAGPVDVGPHLPEGLGHGEPIVRHRLQEQVRSRKAGGPDQLRLLPDLAENLLVRYRLVPKLGRDLGGSFSQFQVGHAENRSFPAPSRWLWI